MFWENYGPEIIRDKRSTTEAEIYESEKGKNKGQTLKIRICKNNQKNNHNRAEKFRKIRTISENQKKSEQFQKTRTISENQNNFRIISE